MQVQWVASRRFCQQVKPAMNLADTYDPTQVEQAKWYEREWNQLHKHDSASSQGKPFTMLMPPPNITGHLHLGHAYTLTVQDILTRWRRMCGDSVLWIPGLDHAGIATQVVVERQLAAQGIPNRHTIGREEFLKRVWDWKHQNEHIILQQMKSLGISCDWSKQFFTMDEHHSRAVESAFVQLHRDGLLYRAERIVNWCCALRSTVSDIEVDTMPIQEPIKLKLPNRVKKVEFGYLDTFAYRLADDGGHASSSYPPSSSSFPAEIVVCTTRLETMLGDTGIAVHPNDSRYAHLIGRQVLHPIITGRRLPIVADGSVDPQFGSGAVKLTPAHSLIDFQLGTTHSLDRVNILDDSGKLVQVPQPYLAMDRYDARDQLRDHLNTLGLYRGRTVNPQVMHLPICSRTGDVIEAVIRFQWFLNCKEMAARALQVVEQGALTFSPSSHTAVWRDWMTKCTDWCVSRQLWWGHRIPAYHRPSATTLDGREWKVLTREEAAVDSELTTSATSSEWKQEDDVLDTWFSSALLPLSSLGWPNQQAAFSSPRFPMNILETGHDILFFWVARMVMLSLQLSNQLPFREVVMHSLICDGAGKKMSKSHGNSVDPMSIIHGTGGLSRDQLGSIVCLGSDSLRFTLSTFSRSGQIMRFQLPQVVDSRKFANKIWQTCRFVAGRTSQAERAAVDWRQRLHSLTLRSQELSLTEIWMLRRLQQCVQQVNQCLHNRDFHLSALELRHFWWNNLCDVFVEYSKHRNTDLANQCLLLSMEVALHLLHPFVPFLTQYLFGHFLARFIQEGDGQNSSSIGCQAFPLAEDFDSLLQHNNLKATLNAVSLYLDECVNAATQINEWCRVLRVPVKTAQASSCVIFHHIPQTDRSMDATLLQQVQGELIPALTKIPVTLLEDNTTSTLDSYYTFPVHSGHCNGVLQLRREFCSVDPAIREIQSRVKKSQDRLHQLNKVGNSSEEETSTDPEAKIRDVQKALERGLGMLEHLESLKKSRESSSA